MLSWNDTTVGRSYIFCALSRADYVQWLDVINRYNAAVLRTTSKSDLKVELGLSQELIRRRSTPNAEATSELQLQQRSPQVVEEHPLADLDD